MLNIMILRRSIINTHILTRAKQILKVVLTYFSAIAITFEIDRVSAILSNGKQKSW